MRRYSIVHPLWMSFYEGAIFSDVAWNWQNRALLYLLLLLGLAWIPYTLQKQKQLDEWIDIEAPYYINQIPTLSLADGKLATQSSGPIFLRSRDGTILAIIDPTGKFTNLNNTTASILITEKEIFIRGEDGQVQVTSLPDSPPETLTQEDLFIFTGWIHWLVNTFLYPIVLLISYIYRILQSLVYAFVVSLLTKDSKVEGLPYITLFNLAIIALTPAIVLDTVHMLMGSPLPEWFWWPACVVLSLGYLRFGTRVAIASKPPEVLKT